MKITIEEYTLTVEREPGDPKFYQSSGSWGNNESRLLYHIKKKLNSMGYDFIKKLMWKDGHLTSQYQHYLRARKIPVKPREIESIWDTSFAVRNCAEDYNEGGVSFGIERG
jgi:hypothetical protein